MLGKLKMKHIIYIVFILCIVAECGWAVIFISVDFCPTFIHSSTLILFLQFIYTDHTALLAFLLLFRQLSIHLKQIFLYFRLW